MATPVALIDECKDLYRRTLLEKIVPFWLKHAVDCGSGAINNCIDDEGNILSSDRYIWSQARALWTFSALYNRMEARPEWLEVAHGLYRYLSQNGRDERGRWIYRLDADGTVLDADISIYVDAFAICGLTEYFLATGDESAARLASETFENTHNRLSRPGSYGIAPYTLPQGMKTLGVPMLFSFFYHNLGHALGRPEISRIGHDYALEILSDFYDTKRDAVLEMVALDGRRERLRGSGRDSSPPLLSKHALRFDLPEARVCVPGHVIEAMWFLATIFDEIQETERIPECCRLIKRHVELGWDETYGGIRLAIDVDGSENVAWQKADCKPWWVQVEALVATACAYLHTNDPWFLDRHLAIRDYAFSHYPTPSGEWTQWLDRYGRHTETAALPVKDPFHLPRGLIYLIESLDRLRQFPRER